MPDFLIPASLIRAFILVGLIVLVIYRFALSLPRADQSHRPEDTGLDPGWAVLADQPLAFSIIVGDYDEWLALGYLTTIWGADPPVYLHPLCQVGPLGPADGWEHSQGASAVYLTRHAATADPGCLADQHRYAAGVSLIRVQAVPNTQMPQSAQPIAFEFGPELTLAGFDVQLSPTRGPEGEPHAAHPGARWHLSLYWRANAAMDVDYTVSVRPLRDGTLITGEDGEPLIQDHQPVWGVYPTSRWSPGEVVRDDYVLSLPNQVNPNGVQVVVYRGAEEGFENLGEANLAFCR
jgi:hypothetical protein